jgi:hypothetical protein
MNCKLECFHLEVLETHLLLLYFRVEHTDCFGRTRKILRKDLKKMKDQDEQLVDVAESRDQQDTTHRSPSVSSESSGEISDDDKGSFIGPDIGLQFMKQREEWEKQEEVNKERPILHYQDILFDGELDAYQKNFFIRFTIIFYNNLLFYA